MEKFAKGEKVYIVPRTSGVEQLEGLVIDDDGSDVVQTTFGAALRDRLARNRRGRHPPAYAERPLTNEEIEEMRRSEGRQA